MNAHVPQVQEANALRRKTRPTGFPLYESAKKAYPQHFDGLYRRIKWGLLAACLSLYYFLPFVRWIAACTCPTRR